VKNIKINMYYILFTTTTCPKCPSFKKVVLDTAKIDGEIIDETSGKFLNLAARFGVMNAPTFIAFKDDSLNEEVFRCSEEYELKKFLENNKI